MLLHSVINNNNIYDHVTITVSGTVTKCLNEQYPFLDKVSPIYMNIINGYYKIMYILDSIGIIHFIYNNTHKSINLQEMNVSLLDGIVYSSYMTTNTILENIKCGMKTIEVPNKIPEIYINFDEKIMCKYSLRDRCEIKYALNNYVCHDYHDDLNNVENIYEVIEKSNYYYIKYKNGDFYKWITTRSKSRSQCVLLENATFVCNIQGQYVVLNNVIVSKYNIYATFKGRIKRVDNLNINMVNNYKFNGIAFSPNSYKLLDNHTKKIINTIIICNYYAPIKIIPKYLLYDIISNGL
jgi:hypothetical protein